MAYLGGAVYTGNNGSNLLTLSNCDFFENEAVDFSGDVYPDSSNSSDSSYDLSYSKGGAICLLGYSATISDCTVRYNSIYVFIFI